MANLNHKQFKASLLRWKAYPQALRFLLYLRGVKLGKKDSAELDRLCAEDNKIADNY